jgi:hypothetical protein
MQNHKNTKCSYIDRFSLTQILVMRTAWYGFIAIGITGIALHSFSWAAIYTTVTFFAFTLGVMPTICAHCPYPVERDTCLFAPPFLIKKFYPYKGPEVSFRESVITIFALATVVIFPQYWLNKNSFLQALFWIIFLPSIAAFPFFYCKRCRHTGCPLNQTEGN